MKGLQLSTLEKCISICLTHLLTFPVDSLWTMWTWRRLDPHSCATASPRLRVTHLPASFRYRELCFWLSTVEKSLISLLTCLLVQFTRILHVRQHWARCSVDTIRVVNHTVEFVWPKPVWWFATGPTLAHWRPCSHTRYGSDLPIVLWTRLIIRLPCSGRWNCILGDRCKLNKTYRSWRRTMSSFHFCCFFYGFSTFFSVNELFCNQLTHIQHDANNVKTLPLRDVMLALHNWKCLRAEQLCKMGAIDIQRPWLRLITL